MTASRAHIPCDRQSRPAHDLCIKRCRCPSACCMCPVVYPLACARSHLYAHNGQSMRRPALPRTCPERASNAREGAGGCRRWLPAMPQDGPPMSSTAPETPPACSGRPAGFEKTLRPRAKAYAHAYAALVPRIGLRRRSGAGPRSLISLVLTIQVPGRAGRRVMAAASPRCVAAAGIVATRTSAALQRLPVSRPD